MSKNLVDADLEFTPQFDATSNYIEELNIKVKNKNGDIIKDFTIADRTMFKDSSDKLYATKINGKWYHFKIKFYPTHSKYDTFSVKRLKKELNYLTLMFENDYSDPGKPKAGSYFFDNLFTSEQLTDKKSKKKTHTYIFVYSPDATTKQKTASNQFWKNLIEINDPRNLNQENDYDHSTTYKGGKRGIRKVRSTLNRTRRIPRQNAKKSRRLKNKSLLNK
jgi:hypothetical protein